MCAPENRTATLRLSGVTAFAAAVLASVSVADSPARAAGMQRDADADVAYIFVDPRLTKEKRELNLGRAVARHRANGTA